MGKNGGKRPGAGRKALDKRPGKNSVSEATAKLDAAQPKACDTLIAALDAFDEDGNPDWTARIAAAKCITAKRIPDVTRTVLAGDSESPLKVDHNLNFRNMTDDELNRFLDQTKKN